MCIRDRNYVRLQGTGTSIAAYASDKFELVLYDGKRQIASTVDLHPHDRFRRLLLKTCPRYRDACRKYPPETLFQVRGNNLDLCFLEVVWRYSHAVGEAALQHRCFLQWPPDDNWVGFCR